MNSDFGEILMVTKMIESVAGVVVVDDDVCLVGLMPAWHFSHLGAASSKQAVSGFSGAQHSIVSVVHSWTLFQNDRDDLAEEDNDDDDNGDDDDDNNVCKDWQVLVVVWQQLIKQ